MHREQRGMAAIRYPEGEPGVDEETPGGLTVIGDFSGRTSPRSTDELRQQLQEKAIDSVEDLCRAFAIRVEGAYDGPDGERRRVSFPARDEGSFTADGLTRGDDGIHELYVRTRAFEVAQALLEERDRGALDEAEESFLRSVLASLEDAEGGAR